MARRSSAGVAALPALIRDQGLRQKFRNRVVRPRDHERRVQAMPHEAKSAGPKSERVGGWKFSASRHQRWPVYGH